ncbi:MAG: glutamine-hydrolyzing carbamoyl-phosphate synthase small subunit [Spirochaetales bacterium]|uniref:Carbamoyl phosphate synthase small chain n=1 Tax=Candidatus Thalassospirochaeta sargassi TaxID=3119039 RepID=A0AAJ1IJL6_9SPIO|nr:glutamine-hydrolyzing carbamoyl-phosphate synthase small subunit [Spirochaetales bacterium]
MKKNSCLVLEDGSFFAGISFGAEPGEETNGEVVFNTGMSGYHEILTDPSYTGQIVMMTYPHIGNYGDMQAWTEVGPEEEGRRTIKARALVVRSVYKGRVYEGRQTLDNFMKENGVCGISDIDTRALTLKLRENGSQKGCIIKCEILDGKPSETALAAAAERIKNMPDMQGLNLIGNVGTAGDQVVNPGKKTSFAVVDCGIKANIVRELVKRDITVRLFQSSSSAEDILNSGVKGVLFSNGPGDPAVLEKQIGLVEDLIDKIPVFGICLGHQLISLALGAETYKMKFGHHGINNPVRDEITGKVFVSSQNHGFAVKEESLPSDVKLWFMNANDKSVEGIISKDRKIASVQFHPEAAPGPVDTSWIFDEYISIAEGK